MTTDQQKAYDIGYKAFTTGVPLTGKVRIDRTAFTTNNYQTFGGDFSLTSSLYDYYVNGYNQAKADSEKKTAIPEFPESAARVMIVNEFTRLKRSYTVAELNNYLTLARLDWKDMGSSATFAGLTEKMRARINSLPPQEPAVVDNQQDYAPVIQSPSTPATTQPATITLPENIASLFGPVANIPGTVTTTPATTAQTTQTVTSISDVVDNALDYAPAIASTDTAVATTTDTTAVTQAGISSNTLAIILLIGAALGVIFAMFKGVKK